MQNQTELDILYKLKKEVEKSDHHQLVTMINQIIKKVFLNHYTLTFVGHFSAGKSTLINHLIEQEILPSSPVPTTSNTALVTVAKENSITANLENQKYTILKDYSEVKQMNRENFNVESIDIRFKTNLFNDGLTFQDTPGVDSNVQSHSMSTESFLYTSNIVFYTVDYNHVQSALNFEFMKRLNQARIPVVFVINQIDKHQDNEISFDTFKTRVQKSISDWDIDLIETFYVSKFDHPNNQIDQLKSFIHSHDNNRESISDFVNRITTFITSKQSSYLNNAMDFILEELNIEADEFDHAYNKFQQNEAVSEEAKLLNDKSALKHYLYEKRKSIIDNAYIMTHDTREQIRHYLESMTKDFKVGGFLNKKKKTEAERTVRLEQLMSQLQNKITQNIYKPMQDDMAFLTRFSNDTNLNEHILNQEVKLPETLVTDLYQTQINISNQYVLTFAEDLMKSIRQFILKNSEPLDEKIVKTVKADDNTHVDNETQNLYDRYLSLNQLKRSLDTENYRHYYIHMDDSLDKLIDRKRIEYHPKHEDSIDEHKNSDTEIKKSLSSSFSKDEVLSALDLLKNGPLFHNTLQNIQNTLKRMDNRIIKIGVFGTFSAGKSSLINALLGDHYLVSSPNPTTAATTEISYGNQNHITFKTQASLLEEINNVTDIIGHTFNSIQSFLDFDKTQLKASIDKNRVAFIEAIEKNYTLYEDLVQKGLEHAISKDEVRKWSAEDEYATFVDKVSIQLPIDWLKDKVIIDSLGLHSNNQRHTHETEKILTTSDLILYVSYFNHSFTDNDKLFIEHMKNINQLAEQQAFKMVINASDLAESEHDEEAVKEYVRNALLDVQMSPEIFSVSSRNALIDSDDGVAALKESIEHFTKVESKHVLERNIMNQLGYVRHAYQNMVTDYETNHHELQQNKQQLKTLSQPTIFNQDQIISSLVQKTSNEIDDQLYHLNERLKIQLLDDVKSVFNGQMTDTKDFKQEKIRASKIYLDQIHQKLYLEQTLLVERVKHFHRNTFENEIAPVLKQLQQYHIMVESDLSKKVDDIQEAFLKIELNSFTRELPKVLTKKHILNPQYQKEIHEIIKDNTIELLQPKIHDLKQSLEDLLNRLKSSSKERLNEMEATAQHEVTSMIQFDLDDEQINEIKSLIKQFDQTISIEEAQHV